MTKIVHLDTETTGLNPRIHHAWEVAVIVEEPGKEPLERQWFLPVDLTTADPDALSIGGFWNRHPQGSGAVKGRLKEPAGVARKVARILSGAVVVGSNPTFDQSMLTPFLTTHGQIWAAHYRMVDVITLGAGRLMACLPQELPTLGFRPPTVPFKTTDISRAFGVDPDNYDRHTALGDCQWTKALYEAITGQGRVRA